MLAVDRQKIIDSLQELPRKTSIEAAMERLYLLSKIEKGIAQADKGECISHSEAKKRFKNWLK